jgi:hypothetical protein
LNVGKCKGPRIDPWDAPYFAVPSFKRSELY